MGHVGDRPANRHRRPIEAGRKAIGVAPDGSLGGAVLVDQHCPLILRIVKMDEGGVARFSGHHDRIQRRQLPAFTFFEQQMIKRRQSQQMGDLLLVDRLRQIENVLMKTVTRQNQRAALAEGPKQADHRAVKGER